MDILPKHFFSKEKENLNENEKLCIKYLEDIFQQISKFGNETDIIELFHVANIMTDAKRNIDVNYLFNQITQNIINYLSGLNIDKNITDEIFKKINNYQELLIFSDFETESEECEIISTYKKKFEYVSNFLSSVCYTDKQISLLALGSSQVGKTSFVKKIFNLGDKIILKGGIESDTENVEIHKSLINGVNFIYADCPGFFDSRGEEKNNENINKITDYVTKNKIDIILWFSKIDDVVDLNQQEILIEITKKSGDNIWKKIIVVLTHANNIPPEEYFQNEDGDYDDLTGDVEAWKSYTKKKEIIWKEIMCKISGDINLNVPIVLTENNKRLIQMINNVGTLMDGTPIIETVLVEMFKIIESDQIPILLLSLMRKNEKIDSEKTIEGSTNEQKIKQTIKYSQNLINSSKKKTKKKNHKKKLKRQNLLDELLETEYEISFKNVIKRFNEDGNIISFIKMIFKCLEKIQRKIQRKIYLNN